MTTVDLRTFIAELRVRLERGEVHGQRDRCSAMTSAARRGIPGARARG